MPSMVERAAERITRDIQSAAEPSKMSPSEAIEFYELIRDEAKSWIETLKSENPDA